MSWRQLQPFLRPSKNSSYWTVMDRELLRPLWRTPKAVLALGRCASGNDLRVDVHRGRDARVPHLTLHAISGRLPLEPATSRVTFADIASSRMTAPALRAAGWMCRSRTFWSFIGLPCLHALENQIVWPCRFDQFVFSDRTPRPNFYGESFQAKDASDYFWRRRQSSLHRRWFWEPTSHHGRIVPRP